MNSQNFFSGHAPAYMTGKKSRPHRTKLFKAPAQPHQKSEADTLISNYYDVVNGMNPTSTLPNAVLTAVSWNVVIPTHMCDDSLYAVVLDASCATGVLAIYGSGPNGKVTVAPFSDDIVQIFNAAEQVRVANLSVQSPPSGWSYTTLTAGVLNALVQAPTKSQGTMLVALPTDPRSVAPSTTSDLDFTKLILVAPQDLTGTHVTLSGTVAYDFVTSVTQPSSWGRAPLNGFFGSLGSIIKSAAQNVSSVASQVVNKATEILPGLASRALAAVLDGEIDIPYVSPIIKSANLILPVSSRVEGVALDKAIHMHPEAFVRADKLIRNIRHFNYSLATHLSTMFAKGK